MPRRDAARGLRRGDAARRRWLGLCRGEAARLRWLERRLGRVCALLCRGATLRACAGWGGGAVAPARSRLRAALSWRPHAPRRRVRCRAATKGEQQNSWTDFLSKIDTSSQKVKTNL
jgi:hypothetical protein